MAEIDFYVNTAGFDYDLETNGSGLAFFGGAGFGTPVSVGAYQDTTFVSGGAGVEKGAQGKNVKWLLDTVPGGTAAQVASGVIAGSVESALRDIPNYQSSLNIRFTHGSAVKVQNAEMRIYNRTSITTAATGVTTKVAEIIHPPVTTGGGYPTTPFGSGDTDWITPAGSAVVVDFANSPGQYGWNAGTDGNAGGSFTRHDWYAAISASPDSIGNKTAYGLYFALEYL